MSHFYYGIEEYCCCTSMVVDLLLDYSLNNRVEYGTVGSSNEEPACFLKKIQEMDLALFERSIGFVVLQLIRANSAGTGLN